MKINLEEIKRLIEFLKEQIEVEQEELNESRKGKTQNSYGAGYSCGTIQLAKVILRVLEGEGLENLNG